MFSFASYGNDDLLLGQKLKIENLKYSGKTDDINTENGIDPDTYIIGQGDQFTIYAINSPSVIFSGQVTQEADLFIPDVGLIKVGPLSLTDAKGIINKSLQNLLKGKIEYYISLSKVKSSTVFISGSVINPGTYTLRGNHRLLDAINKANMDTSVLNRPNSNIREIELISKDTTKIDLYQYLCNNDLSNNPYVYPGQKIFVPYKNERAILVGPITNQFQGDVPIKKDESLRSLLGLCSFDKSADTNCIYVKRSKSGEVIKTSFDQSSQITLNDLDIVTVCKKENYPQIEMVSVVGEVQRPGDYAINYGNTTIGQIMSIAGGINETGDSKRTCIIRRKIFPSENISKTSNISSISLRPELSTGLSRMSSFKDYSILSIRENDSNLLVNKGDTIYVPKKEFFVYVSGNVIRPGAIEYDESKDFNYYIKKAGGLSRFADKKSAFVVTVYLNSIVNIKGTKFLSSGDIIVIPEKQQYRYWSVVLLPLVTALLTSVSLFWTIYNSN